MDFDEWHMKKYGYDFDSRMNNGSFIADVMMQLTRDLRDYISELIQGAIQ